MKRLAPVAASLAMILVALLVYDKRRAGRAVAPPTVSTEEPAAEVFPATLGAWTNLERTAKTTPVSRVSSSPAQPQSVAFAVPPSAVVAQPAELDTEATQIRTRELLARAALPAVGNDPEADQYWVAAISDQRLPADVRRELIQELREAGFSDPTRAGAEDLVLLASRIALLEEVGRQALDLSDAATLQEVHGELMSRLTAASTPEPVAPIPEAE